MCMYCKNSTTVNSTTTHVVNYKNCIIVIKNILCLECEQCGEKYYTDEVAERLEEIINTAKKLMQEIAVIDYPQVAQYFHTSNQAVSILLDTAHFYFILKLFFKIFFLFTQPI